MNENKLKSDNKNIKELIELIECGEIVVPEIQRGLVWDEEMKKKFLQSIIKKYPYGAIILGRTHEDKKKFIIDGLQRTTTLISIYNNCYKYIDKETIDELFKYFREQIKEHIEDLHGPKIAKDWITKNKEMMHQCFHKNILNWKEHDVINFEECVICYPFLTNEYSDKLNKYYRLTYKYFRNEIISIDNFELKIQEFTGTMEDISKIFIVINEQGKPLSEIEILKSKLSLNSVDNNKIKSILNNIVEYKKNHFVSLINSFDNTIQIQENNNVSYFDLFYYITYHTLEKQNKDFKDGVYLKKVNNVSDSKTKQSDWFKITRFIIASLYKGHIKSNMSLEEVIKFFFDMEYNEDQISIIENTLSNSISYLYKNLNFPKYNVKQNNDKHMNKNFCFNVTEEILLVSIIFDKLLNHKNIDPNNIYKMILMNSINNRFGSASNDKAFDIFINEEVDNNVTKEMILQNISTKKETNFNDETSILKILTPLVFLCGDKPKEITFMELVNLNDFNNNITDSRKKLYINCIANHLIFVDSKEISKISKKDLRIENFEKEYFYQKSNNKELKEKFINLVQKLIISKKQIDDVECENLLDVRNKLIEDVIKNNV